MNENTAAAIVYGLPKADLPETDPFNVILLDVGHAHLQARPPDA
jgi:molecular chaperone DnaK (HSP70)